MTIRQEKRIRRKKLIYQLQRLEMQHQRVSGADFIISSCKGCEICTKIREIGEELAPSDVDICTASGLTVEKFHEMRKQGMSYDVIARKIMVSKTSLIRWIKTFIPKPVVEKVEKVDDPGGRPNESFKPLNISKEKFIELRKEGISFNVIAEIAGCSRVTLRSWIERNGLSHIKRRLNNEQSKTTSNH